MKELIIGSLVLAALSTGAAYWQWERAKVLQERVETRDAIIAQLDRSIAIHTRYIADLEKRQAALTETLDELEKMEGRDAPLSDLLRATGDAAERLR